ncbi:MAG: ABC transporter permease [Chlorobiaceae bacterium]|nr:ABC transporter permease [Chlorobiaceae bacterium]NTW74439.1 ABC transporter permease [Chlorobiaceae bacterium]
MQRFIGFVRKEFSHIVRDRRTAAILFGMPVLQLLLFGFAIKNEISEIRVGILDHSHDLVTQELTDKLLSSGTFVATATLSNEREAGEAFASGRVNEVVVFEPAFGDRLLRDGHAGLQLLTDGSDPNVSRIVAGYTTSVVREYLREKGLAASGIEAVPLMMFNPGLKSVYLFVPGLMAMILMLVSALMTSISITREKESGTMELLLVSSLRPVQIIIGKVVPYLVLAFVNVITVVALAFFVFGVPCRGSILLLFLESLLFILTALSLGLLISTITSSQQVAMMISLAGLLLPTVLLSGFIFPIASMPWPLQAISNLIPARWYLVIVRGVMLKGAGIAVLWKETLILVVMTALYLTFSVRKFSERLQ